MVKVSIVVPVYKSAVYLHQCLDSLLNQTLPDIEVVAVNDGSPDNSLEILQQYQKKDSRLKIISKSNGGIASAYNAGIQAATGEYIGFCDADDWMDVHMYQHLYSVAEKLHPDVIKSYGYFAENGETTNLSVVIPTTKCGRLISNSLFLPEFVKGMVCHWSAIYRRAFLKENGILCEDFREMPPDIDFVYKVWVLAKTFFCVPVAFAHYRIDNPDSAKNMETKMSNWLLNAHIVSQKSLENLSNKVTKNHWRIKARVEYDHLKFEIIGRSKRKRYPLIQKVGKLFKSNIEKKYVDRRDFSYLEWLNYRMLAYHPRLWWLSDVSRIFCKKAIPKGGKYYVLFGLITNVVTPKHDKIYFLGIRIRDRRIYDTDFVDLHNHIFELQNQLQVLMNQIKPMGRRNSMDSRI